MRKLHEKLSLKVHALMCVCVCVSVVDLDGGPAKGAAGGRLFGLGWFGSGADKTVSAAADGHTGGHTQRH